VNKPHAQSVPVPHPADEDQPLVMDDSESPQQAADAPETPDASGESPVSSSRTSKDNAADGTTTGGFETMLGKVVVESGLVTSDELDLCNQILRDAQQAENPQTLGDLLVSNDYATEHQLGRLRAEFEAQKSSQRIPGYKIRRKVGSGAMATVFLAHQVSLDRSVAIKVLPKKFSDNKSFIERFYQEGRSVAKLNHPNIVAAFDVGKAGEHHFFVMEYVDGPTVYDLITKKKRVPEAEAIDVIRQTALALQHAHERGFIHRDIKPKNIMVDQDGVVKLADLGLARALSDKDAAQAEAGRAYGTPYYISPEQIRGDVKIGPGADLYGLGATFYHMVTGRVPFSGKNPSEVMHKHLKSELAPPDHRNPELSGGCAQVIEMMMAKSPKDRYQSAADLIEDLELVARGELPHFAHRELELVQMAESLTSDAKLEVVKKVPEDRAAKQRSLINALMITVGILALRNIVLVAILLAT
jgi:serine/threonine-protein kinase